MERGPTGQQCCTLNKSARRGRDPEARGRGGGNTLIAHVVRSARFVDVDRLSCLVDEAGAHKSVAKNVGCGLDCLLALGQSFADPCKTGLSFSAGLERFAGSLALEDAGTASH